MQAYMYVRQSSLRWRTCMTLHYFAQKNIYFFLMPFDALVSTAQKGLPGETSVIYWAQLFKGWITVSTW